MLVGGMLSGLFVSTCAAEWIAQESGNFALPVCFTLTCQFSDHFVGSVKLFLENICQESKTTYI